jgi:DNA-binding NarL/FixJ family response regulator
MVRVLLADDHPVVLDGLQRFLERAAHVQVVDTASSLTAALEVVGRRRVDVLVADVNMPGMDGVETVRELSRRHGFPHIVIFSMLDEDRFALDLLRAGAKAYLSKARSPQELLEAIYKAAEGRTALTDRLAEQMLSDGPRSAAPHEELSERERQVFLLIVDGLSPKQVSKRLGLSPSTVYTYTERVKDKLSVDSVAGLVRYAFRHGLSS